ncbi:MAG: class I SAM-dependent methyltransferase [Polyangiaceae bacterium]|jgi:ubiquinone/menaquinone biosynthesis C-methylase UbiE
MPELTKSLVQGLRPNGPTDPILFYRRPVVGWLYRERINLGLRLLPAARFDSVLEVGYGAGAVLLTLAPTSGELSGIDLDADPAPVHALLRAHGYGANLSQANVYELPFPDGRFDLVVCFSVFEHLRDYARGLSEVTRVLKPGGHFLLGMPAVNRFMEAAFLGIGFKGIEDHHITTPASVARAFDAAGLRVVKRKNLVFPVPGMTLYYNWLLERR